MSNTSRVTKELADVDRQLRALPDDAFAEKFALLKKQDALREALTELLSDALVETKKQWDAQAGEKRRDDSQDVGMVVSPIEPGGGA